ncbi:glycosyltransferase [Algoriphagus sp. A40]|uniref:glycosyltransferase n=1 Tax=Algoriphagus sp. A40 TaxID=1945863 RepID=UPI00098758D5|nr:glycosyltransferase [Algoriphagus sp. A40]OOG75277.1 hypothetical protein B0E43_09840 [Algoriphagus sp. A40]
MICFYLIWTLCYIVLLAWFAKKWPNPALKTDLPEVFPEVTLLIPIRNEIKILSRLIDQIHQIDYPKLRVILIDDQSEDGSLDFLRDNLAGDPRVKVIQSPGSGKKSALQFGVEKADSDLILCTDADCRFSRNWVQQMVLPFANPKTQLVAGPVLSTGQNTFFQRFQQIEWSSILLVTQFFFTQKKPLMCSGANLAYRKSAFVQVNGYQQNLKHLSGDDEFLLKAISARFGEKSCVYLPFSKNLVFTDPQPDLANLINQRVRWAGKWKVHRDFSHSASAVFSVIVQLVWLGSLVLVSFGLPGLLVFFLVWAGKILTEKKALGKVLECLGNRHFLIDFIKTGLFHPVFVVWVAAATAKGNFVWKGRTN